MQGKVLVTGFDPFNGEKINPSYEAVKKLESSISGYEIIKLELGTEYNNSIDSLYRKIDEESPDLVILVGQAGGSPGIRLERIGINCRDAKIKDNIGELYQGEKIFPVGDDGYFSNLPLNKIEKALKDINIPVIISNSAGTFVCNNLLYSLMYKIRKEELNILGGFVHVPFIPDQVVDRPNSPSMSIDNIVMGLRKAIGVSIEELNKQ